MATCAECKGVISNVDGKIIDVVKLCAVHRRTADYLTALQRIAKLPHDLRCRSFLDETCNCHVSIAAAAVGGEKEAKGE